MHFDEVYHARTATEFLQDWRYGESHDIYEWTHPHLAKYAMAAGLVLWGEDHVSGTGDLGVPVVGGRHRATTARTRSPASGPASASTSRPATEIRTDDLRTRRTVSTFAAPGSAALAVDDSAEQLLIGFDDGRIATVDLAIIGVDGVDSGVEPIPLATVDHPVTHLLVSDDGATIIAASDDRLSAVDPATGDVTGHARPARHRRPGHGRHRAGARRHARRHRRTGRRRRRARRDPRDRCRRLRGAPGRRRPGRDGLLGGPGNDDATRTEVDEAIADGRLAGIEIVDLSRVAVADRRWHHLHRPGDGRRRRATIEMSGGAHGLAYVIGIDDPKLYVTAGGADDPGYEIVAVGGDSAEERPGHGRRAASAAGRGVARGLRRRHAAGPRPGARVRAGGARAGGGDAGGWTVYVIEPTARATRSTPTPGCRRAWSPPRGRSTSKPDYPAEDRQQLLVFGADGQTATIETGSHAFAWRLPGVIAGALMAACLYLLARILFARRLVAGLVGGVRARSMGCSSSSRGSA